MPGFDEYMGQIRALVKEYGWAVQGVFPTEPGDLGFSYTVGLTAAGLPELVLSGAYDDRAKALLNTAARLHAGSEFKHGDTVDGIGSVDFRVIDAPAAEVGVARRLYGRKVRAVQLVWPDKDGHWPGSVFASVQQELFGKAWW